MRYNTPIDFIQSSGGNILDVHHAEFEPSIQRGECIPPTLAEMWVIDDAPGDNTDETLVSTITTCVGDGIQNVVCGTLIDPPAGNATICRVEFPNLSLLRAGDVIRIHEIGIGFASNVSIDPYDSSDGVELINSISVGISLATGQAWFVFILDQPFINNLLDQGQILEDFYNFSNIDQELVVGTFNDQVGQSITGAGGVLTEAGFRLRRQGSPTGNIRAHLYAHTGTFGISSVPTGSPLATSSDIDVALIPTSAGQINFVFNDEFTLVNSTNYVITVEYTEGDGANFIAIGQDNNDGTHAGNTAVFNVSWIADATDDLAFKVITGDKNGTFAIRFKVGSGSNLDLSFSEIEGCFLYALDPTGFTAPSGTLWYEPEEEQIERLAYQGSSGILQVRNVEGIGYYENTTLQEMNPGPYTVQWDQTLVDDMGFTFLSSDSESIILPIDGLYKLNYHVQFINNTGGGSSDTSLQAQLIHNGSGMAGSLMSTYLPTGANGGETQITCYYMAIARAGDEIQLEVDFLGGVLSSVDVADTYLEVEFIRRGEMQTAMVAALEARQILG